MRRSSFFLIAFFWMAAGALQATSYVRVADEALVNQASAIVVATLGPASPSTRAGMPATEYPAAVERSSRARSRPTNR
jgi:hypothetical protein